MDPNRSKQRYETIRIPGNNLLLAQNVIKTRVIKTRCSRYNWFCFSLAEKLAGDLLANRYVWQSQSRNYFRQSFENCTKRNDNLLSTKVESGSIVVGIVKEKKGEIHFGNCQSPLYLVSLSSEILKVKETITMHIHSNKANVNIFCSLAPNRIRKCGHFKLWFCKGWHRIVVKYMPHVQHAYFSLFNQ